MTEKYKPIRPQNSPVPAQALQLIPREVALRHRICPLDLTTNAQGEKVLAVACPQPDDHQLIDSLQRITRCRIQPVLASPQDITLGIAVHYSAPPETTPESLFALSEDEKPLQPPEEAPRKSAAASTVDGLSVSQLLNRIMQAAIAQRATDVHFEPYETAVYVRFRVDGFLVDHLTYQAEQHPAMSARIKVLANLDVAQNRVLQEGRFDIRFDERAFDIRVSIHPAVNGESIVLHLMPKGVPAVMFPDLGFNAEHTGLLDAIIQESSGMLLLAGPAGSGLTTTLYACLSRVDCVARKVVTIEDPVEYQLPRITQTQVNARSGLTYAAGLHSLLRQDADVIMVSELRDPETLDLAMHAALTGRLIFSTLHCSDAAAAVARMVEMGAEPFLVASSVRGITAQRLVRTICPACKEAQEISPALCERLGLPDEPPVLYHGRGCARCSGSGYFGRTGIFEVLPMTAAVAEAITGGTGAGDIRRLIRSRQVNSLWEAGLAKARAGITTLDEVVRVTAAIRPE